MFLVNPINESEIAEFYKKIFGQSEDASMEAELWLGVKVLMVSMQQYLTEFFKINKEIAAQYGNARMMMLATLKSILIFKGFWHLFFEFRKIFHFWRTIGAVGNFLHILKNFR